MNKSMTFADRLSYLIALTECTSSPVNCPVLCRTQTFAQPAVPLPHRHVAICVVTSQIARDLTSISLVEG